MFAVGYEAQFMGEQAEKQFQDKIACNSLAGKVICFNTGIIGPRVNSALHDVCGNGSGYVASLTGC